MRMLSVGREMSVRWKIIEEDSSHVNNRRAPYTWHMAHGLLGEVLGRQQCRNDRGEPTYPRPNGYEEPRRQRTCVETTEVCLDPLVGLCESWGAGMGRRIRETSDGVTTQQPWMQKGKALAERSRRWRL